MKFNQRVYGIIGVASYMANWNADFTGRPKSTSSGHVFGSDKALKYAIKHYWEQNEEKVLYIKSYTIGKSSKKFIPRDLTERYQYIFNEEVKKKDESEKVLSNLFSAIDVLNFGATFAVEGQNIGLTGIVQIGQGINRLEDSKTEIQDILSPFRNSKKETPESSEQKDAASIGKKVVSNEAHYFYPFSVNPNHYDQYIGLVDGFEGYTEEAYHKFKDAALVAATALNTNSKSGCSNEFSLFITCKEGSHLYLPQLDNYIDYQKMDNKNVIDLEKLDALIKPFTEQIEQVEVFYDPYHVEVVNAENFMLKNIFTKELV
ncbi:CRISPR-associated protein [Terrilactibacillus sp. BCM23-1]|uniref:CRISPR-associated protein n=1 Tax=Terrilactibacillus tamarindi TaxID=2599694 RepID=A0A6N8CQD2_9BACI|nr:type I CRISPR-associated protein Cas7 [Terrilactibacillus tamarindi]MTT31377.1 CRISPR-associated protein [Terrilactibacillus tamarindi]